MRYDRVKENAAKCSQEMLGWSLDDGAAKASMARAGTAGHVLHLRCTGLLKQNT